MPFEPLYGNKQALFDANKLQWLGSPSQEFAVFAIWHTSPVNKIEDAKTHELVVGASGSNSSSAFYGRLFRAVFDVKIKILAGYAGAAEALLAMERGENDGNSSAYWSSLKAIEPDWIADKKIKFLAAIWLASASRTQRRAVCARPDQGSGQARADGGGAGPARLGPTDRRSSRVPPDRVAALRTALAETFRDPDYLAECAPMRLECDDPITAQTVTDALTHAYNATPEVVRELRQIYQSGDSK